MQGLSGNRHEDVEIALVCPPAVFTDVEKDSLLKNEKKMNVKKRHDFLGVVADGWMSFQDCYVDRTCRCFFSSIVTLLMIGIIFLCFYYCRVCLIGVLMISAIMVFIDPYWSIPMWLSLVLLIVFGYSVVQGDIMFIWKTKQ